MIRWFYIWAVTMICHGCLKAQEQFKFLHFDSSDGLSQNRVNDITEDYLGYLWVATGDGLNRYDGSDFKVYRQKLGSGLGIYTINAITQTKDSLLWAGLLNGGLITYKRKKDNFRQYVDRNGFSLEGKSVGAILDDGHNNLFVIYNDGQLVLLDRENQNFEWSFTKEMGITGKIVAMTTDGKDQVWLANNTGTVFKLEMEDQLPLRYRIRQQIEVNSSINTLYHHNNTLWLCTSQGLLHLDQKGHIDLLPRLNSELGNISISGIAIDTEDAIWIGSSIRGAFHYNPDFDEIIAFKEANTRQKISDNGIQKIYKDSRDNIWIGTFAGGINLFNKNRHQFDHYILVNSRIGPFRGDNVRSIAQFNDGSVCVANGGELTFFKKGSLIDYRKTKIDSLHVLDKIVHVIYQDSRDNFWVATRSKGVFCINPKKGAIQLPYLKDVQDGYFFENSRGQIVIAYREGVLLIDQELNVKRIQDEHPELKTRVNTVLEDDNGDLFIGTAAKGIYHYDDFRNILEKIPYPPKNSIVAVNTLLKDTSGTIWMGTSGYGLMTYDRKMNRFNEGPFNTQLKSKVIKSLEEDNKGRIWFSSNRGITLYDPKKTELTNYNTDQGLQGDEFIKNSSLKDSEGILYFGGFNGLNRFDPKEFPKPQMENRAHVSNIHFLVENSDKAKVKRDSEGIIREVVMPYFMNHFTVALAAPSFFFSEKPNFSYKLEGYRDDWFSASETNTIRLINLDPGAYRLFVDTDLSLEESKNSQVLQFTITPPFWKTWWAYLCYTVVLIALFLIYRKKTLANERLKSNLRIKEIEAKKIKEITALKSNFFTNISHEFRTPITLMLGPLEGLVKQAKNNDRLLQKYQLMQKNGKKLLRLINQILDISKIESGHMPLKITEGNIVEQIRDVFSSFEYAAEKQRIDYCFEYNYKNLSAYYDVDKIEKIIYNLLSNAFKYTEEGGKIRLILNLIPLSDTQGYADRITITVNDNGIGIREEDLELIFTSFYQGLNIPKKKIPGTGIGLSLTKQLAEVHKGKISVSSDRVKGTIFQVELPLKKAAYPNNLEKVSIGNLDKSLNLDFDESLAMLTFENAAFDNYDQILIIDDNPDILDYLVIELGNDYKICRAKDATAGFRKALNNIPDLIILDVMMPGMNGLELCEKLKSDPRTNHIPIILLTALSETEDKIKGLGLGAEDYITKPFSMALLKQRIENIISNRNNILKKYNVRPTSAKRMVYEDTFIQKVSDTIEEHIEDPLMTVESLAEKFNITSMQLYRKIRGAVNKSPNEFIRFTRLNRASQLLRKETDITVAEVAYKVGYTDPGYFSRSFKKLFKSAPTEFQKRHRRK